MKRLVNFLLIFILIFTLVGCNFFGDSGDDNQDDDDGEVMDNILKIYTINDLHGAIFESGQELGINKIGKFLKSQKVKAENNTIIISAGDMFQGTAVSSLTRGQVIVDWMNYVGFDAMALGNHEFDWDIDDIIRYHDGNLENGEADFPFLGANIYQKSKGKYVDWALPYTIVEKAGLKVGIIGLIGEDQSSSILAPIISDYEFTYQIDIIKEYTKTLRQEKDCDIIIVVSHDDTSRYTSTLSDLEDEYYIDAVINGHTHNDYVYANYRDNHAPLVVIQSGNNGKFIGEITLELDLENKKVIDASAGFVDKSKLNQVDSNIDNILKKYQTYIDISNEVLGKSGQSIDRSLGATWASNTIKTYNNSDIGIVNYGGIRSAAFPISNNQTVTYGNIFKMMPFENAIMTVKLTGMDLKRLLSLPYDLVYSSNVNKSNNTVNGEAIDDNKLYKIAIVDYAFYDYEYIFGNGQDIEIHDMIFRELLVSAVKESVAKNGKWIISR